MSTTKSLPLFRPEMQRLPRKRPWITSRAYLTYQVPAVLLRAGRALATGACYVGKRAGDPNNSFEFPDYTTQDAFASWKIGHLLGKKTSLQLNASNLTDQGYFVSSGEIHGEPVGEKSYS